MKSQAIVVLSIAASMSVAASDLNLGASAAKQNEVIVIDVTQLTSLRDGKDPEKVWKNLNELSYLSRAGSREAYEALFNTLVAVIDSTETIIECDQLQPRYDIKLLLAPLSKDAEIWSYLGKTNKAFCERIQSVYQESPWLYGSKHDNPTEANICEALFRHR